MTETGPQRSDDLVARYVSPGGDNVTLVYILYIASAFLGVTALIGVIMAYLNRGKVEGWPVTHYTFQIRTFWIGLLYGLIAVVLMIVGIGFLLMLAVGIWALVRCIRGLQWAARREPVPDPETWLV